MGEPDNTTIVLGQIGRRLNEYMLHFGIDKPRMADQLAVSTRTVSNLLAGNNCLSTLLVKLGETNPALNLTWLMTGAGEMINGIDTFTWESQLAHLWDEQSRISVPPGPLQDKQAKALTLQHFDLLDKGIDLLLMLSGDMVNLQRSHIQMLIQSKRSHA